MAAEEGHRDRVGEPDAGRHRAVRSNEGPSPTELEVGTHLHNSKTRAGSRKGDMMDADTAYQYNQEAKGEIGGGSVTAEDRTEARASLCGEAGERGDHLGEACTEDTIRPRRGKGSRENYQVSIQRLGQSHGQGPASTLPKNAERGEHILSDQFMQIYIDRKVAHTVTMSGGILEGPSPLQGILHPTGVESGAGVKEDEGDKCE